jgi:hypothetical protein
MQISNKFSPPLLTASFLSVINQSNVGASFLEALRERQTRREAGAQSLRTSLREVAGLPNRAVGLEIKPYFGEKRSKVRSRTILGTASSARSVAGCLPNGVRVLSHRKPYT